jgi:hypothetical protein
MPTELGYVLTHPVGGPPHFLSHLTDMRDGVAFRFTTAYARTPSEIPADANLVGVIDIPAFTNRRPGATAMSLSLAVMTVVIQGVVGDPTQADSAWQDVATFPTIRPHIPLSSDGSGSLAHPIYSNRYRRAFQAEYSSYRFSGQFHGPNPDYSRVYMAIHAGSRRSRERQ